MNFHVHWIDVTPHLMAKEQPVFLLKREVAHTGPKAWAGQSKVGTLGEFWVPGNDLLGFDDPEFARTTIGEAVRIPVIAYKTAHRALPAIFGLGLQIGLAAIGKLRNHVSVEPKAVHLVLGHECTDLQLSGEESFRCYVGLAIQTK